LERDPGFRLPIWLYLINERDNVRRAYIKLKACQPRLENYPKILGKIQKRRFKYSWFEDFPWLKYSESKDKAFCFLHAFFLTKTHQGFQNLPLKGLIIGKELREINVHLQIMKGVLVPHTIML
jgi:hypothetical protein